MSQYTFLFTPYFDDAHFDQLNFSQEVFSIYSCSILVDIAINWNFKTYTICKSTLKLIQDVAKKL